MMIMTIDEFGQLPEIMRSVMARAGVHKVDHAKTLAQIIGVSVPQAYKKLNGTSDMTLSQIDSFNRAYGVRALSAAAALSDSNGSNITTTSINDAIFVAGNERVSCSLSIGAHVRDGYAKRFAAYRIEGTWFIDQMEACPAHSTLYEITHLAINLEMNQAHVRRIAVVDDERGTADNLRDYVIANGNKATAFYDLSSARAVIEKNPFDGYFLDWRLADGTAERLIKYIRTKQPSVPIIVSTAGGADGEVDRPLLDQISEHYNVSCHRKPMKMKILISIMANAFAQMNY